MPNNPSLDYISGNFTNKKLKKIVNVYQIAHKFMIYHLNRFNYNLYLKI